MIGNWHRELPVQQVDQAEYQLSQHPFPKQTKKSLLGNVSDYSRKSWLPIVITIFAVVF